MGAQVATELEADGGREEPPPRAASLLPPPPHARSYLGDYFAWLDEHGDWAGVPPRGQYAAWHGWHDADDAPVKHGAGRPTAARRPPARALPDKGRATCLTKGRAARKQEEAALVCRGGGAGGAG